jgi:uncharacterized protein involved in exopolysaccharide biosynthesis
MHDLPQLPRALPRSTLTPLIPLDYMRPGPSLAQMFSVLRAYRALIATIVALVLAAALVAILFWPRTYVATVTLMVNYEVNDPLNGKELPVGQVASYISTQVELMQTPEVILAVVDRLKLVNDPDYANGYSDTGGSLRNWVAAKVVKNLAVYQSQRGGQLIYITYSANHPNLAARVANTVADIYKEQDALRSAAPPGARAKRYEVQLTALKGKVDEAQQGVTAFQQRNALIDEGNKSNVDLELLATLESRLADARNTRRQAEARTASNQAVSDQVLVSGHVQALQAQLATQELRKAQLDRMYMPQHPDILDAQMQVASTKRTLAASLQTYSDNASVGLSIARRLEAGLQAAVDDQRSKALVKGRLKDESAKKMLELESAQQVYRRALEAYDQIMFASAGPYANVSLVSRALPPVRATKPSVITGLALGVFLALLLGLSVPIGLELFNRRVRCVDDIERAYGVPVLAEFGPLTRRALT